MSFADRILGVKRPARAGEVELPRREPYHPSPADWRDEALYFLLVDRFSDGQEAARPLLDRSSLAAARPALPNGQAWRWDLWARSGAERFQGGTLRGVQSKLPYLRRLGVTALWLSPVFRQRGHQDSYHGYGIQDFLDVDPRFGDRRDLVDLVSAAHQEGLRIVLDVIFNHSGPNWLYPGDEWTVPYKPHPGRHPFGAWLDGQGRSKASVDADDDGVWPAELQEADRYTRAGTGSLGAGDIDDPHAEHKRSDFITLRDFDLSTPELLTALARCYKYWIALTDCDGFRIDTLKHVSFEEARNFCGSIKEFAANLGKANFFLVGEIAGGDLAADRYLDVLALNLNAALDIGEMRLALGGVALGRVPPKAYFDGFDPGRAVLGSHRNSGLQHVSVLDDHDHVFGEKLRFSSGAASPHQVVAGVGLQLFSLGIPCIYYGTEQALAGPEASERRWLPDWGRSDRYLREALFGPERPRGSGRAGLGAPPGGLDPDLPGFGPFGTAGRHCFDESHPAFLRIAALLRLRRARPVLRYGRQYARPVSFLGRPFDLHGPGEVVAWSRILDDEEATCILNAHGSEDRGADVLVDAGLYAADAAVIANTAESASPGAYSGPYAAGSRLPVRRAGDGKAFVEIRDLPPSEILVLTNRA